MILWLDFETASEIDLELAGTWKYCQHKSTKILMLGYAFGEGEEKIWCPHEGPVPEDLKESLLNPFQILAAWHSQFERLILKFVLGIETEIDQWVDPMVICRGLSLPGSLEKVGDILEVAEKKDSNGKRLLEMFSFPLTPSGTVTLFGVEEAFFRNHETNPREFEELKKYCLQDIRSERSIYNLVKKFDLPASEWEYWRVDQIVNDRGIATDSTLLQGASIIVDKEKTALAIEIKEITGLENPNSVKQILGWLKNHKYPFNSLEKKWVKRVLDGEGKVDEEGIKVLKLRAQLSKSSTAKFEAFRNSVNPDGRVRHLFSFMGAARTGRWSGGAGIQPHNLIKAPKSVENKMDRALELLKAADYVTIKKEFEYPLDVAASAIRPILRAAPGHKLLIADLSAIEARGSAWISNCEPMLEIFRQNQDPYLAFAVQLDGHRTYEEMLYEFEVLKNKTHRNNAKAPFLGCSYGLGPGEITYDEDGNTVRTGLLGYASMMGIDLSPEFSTKAVMVFRNSYKSIIDFWYELHRGYINSVENDAIVEVGPIVFEVKGNVLRIWLPSGRALHYLNPRVEWQDAVSKQGRTYRKSILWYDGVNQKTRIWGPVETRGPKILENLVQGICRDILAHGLKNAEDAGLRPVAHVHDEIVCEVSEDSGFTVQDLINCMIATPEWGKDFLLGASGIEGPYYRKD